MIITEAAPAKLNLSLHVRRRRDDGYHDIETLFAFCKDGDVVTLADAEEDSFEITGPFAAVLTSVRAEPVEAHAPNATARDTHFDKLSANGGGSAHVWNGWDNENLVTRAALAFRAQFDIAQPHAITLEKNLPIASGIGGGSADAAATLRALGRRHAIPIESLHDIAVRLGADVPACLYGRTAFGTGKGDALAPLDACRDTPVLLINPRVAVSTAAVFKAWDQQDHGPLDPADPHGGRNDLEAPARALAPAIDDVLAFLAAQPGVTLARMSGSGATCFALFDTPESRDTVTVPNDWWHLTTTLA
jgi:4-diphosphocytidyl-2-C-methyl-D-erythritol kinase